MIAEVKHEQKSGELSLVTWVVPLACGILAQVG